MDDFDLYCALTKTASQPPAEVGKQLMDALKANKAKIIGGAAGLTAVGAGMYAAGRRWGGKQSLLERKSADMVRAHDTAEEARKRDKSEATFSHGLSGTMGRSLKDFAALAKDHPAAAAAFIAPMGIDSGASLGNFISNLSKRLKGLPTP